MTDEQFVLAVKDFYESLLAKGTKDGKARDLAKQYGDSLRISEAARKSCK